MDFVILSIIDGVPQPIGWQPGLLFMMVAIGIIGAVLAYRKTR